MKILVVSNLYPSADDPYYGTFVRNFTESLTEAFPGDVRTCLIRGRRKQKFHRFCTYAGFYLRLLGQTLFGRYDLIYVHTVTFPTPVLRVVSAFRRLPLVFNVHGDDVIPSNRFKCRLRDMCRPLLPKARMIVTPSRYFRGVVLEEFSGLDPERVIVSASGGVAEKFFHKPSKDFDHVPVLGFVSRIDPEKGWDTYIDALVQLRREGVRFRGVMAGAGAQRPQMVAELKSTGLDDCVEFLGPLSQDELAALYPTLDIMVFPSRRRAESLGLVGLEAMASGVPVVACDNNGAASYVEDGVNGYLIKPADATGLVSKIKEFLALDHAGRRAMSLAALDTALEYSSPAVHAGLMAQIRRLL